MIISYCCIDCGTLICKRTALYGTGRCRSCSNIGELNHALGTSQKGKNNSQWKGGKPRCIDCKKLLSDYRSNRCNLCFAKSRKNKSSNQFRFGKDAPSYKDGRTLKKYYCVDCKTQISKYLTKRCYSCFSKHNVGKNNGNFIHGQGNFPYPLIFSNKLKKKIRQRDNFTCQRCDITEHEHKEKYNQVLHVHHIDYNKQNCKENNLITLCQKCNIKANQNIHYWFAYYTYLMEDKDE